MKRKRRKKHPQPKYQALKLLQILGNDVGAKRLGRMIGLHHTTIQRWRNPQTMLDQWDADRYAVQIGKHPSEIWPNWFDVPPDSTDIH